MAPPSNVNRVGPSATGAGRSRSRTHDSASGATANRPGIRERLENLKNQEMPTKRIQMLNAIFTAAWSATRDPDIELFGIEQDVSLVWYMILHPDWRTRAWGNENAADDPIGLELATRGIGAGSSMAFAVSMITPGLFEDPLTTGTFPMAMYSPSEQARHRATQLRLAEAKAKAQLREARSRIDSDVQKYYKSEDEESPSTEEWDALFSELEDLFGGPDSDAESGSDDDGDSDEEDDSDEDDSDEEDDEDEESDEDEDMEDYDDEDELEEDEDPNDEYEDDFFFNPYNDLNNNPYISMVNNRCPVA